MSFLFFFFKFSLSLRWHFVIFSVSLALVSLNLSLSILFFLMLLEIIFLILFSDGSCQYYRNLINFCILILYPATMLNSFICPSSFFFYMNSLGFSVDNIISCVNIASFVFPIPVLLHFISFSCLAALVRTSSTVLNTSGKKEHPYLVLYLFVLDSFLSL